MATIKSHLAKAEHNKALAEFLKGQSDYLDWQVVAIFYAALHKVQAMLRVAGYTEMQTDSHVKVKNILNSEFTDIGVDYTLLLSQSHVSRYDADYVTTVQDVNKAQSLLDSIDTKIRRATAILVKNRTSKGGSDET